MGLGEGGKRGGGEATNAQDGQSGSQGPDVSRLASVGVATTTPVAFYWGEEIHLERMNLISADGAGVLAPCQPPVGVSIPIAFRLSTAIEAVRCQGEVLGNVPTTPEGLALRSDVDEQSFQQSVRASVDDSATAVTDVKELEARAKADQQVVQQASEEPSAQVREVQGFCVRFLCLADDQKAAIARHLRISQRLRHSHAEAGPVVDAPAEQRG